MLSVRKVCTLISAIAAAGMLAAAEPVAVSTSPEVKYVFLDSSFKEFAPDKNPFKSDEKRTLMNDGSTNPDKSISSAWGANLEKKIILRYDFPGSIYASGVNLAWCWTFNVPGMWIDNVKVYAGMTPDERKPVADYTPENKKGGHVQDVPVPFKEKVLAKHITIEITQNAHPEHQMMAFCEITVKGTDARFDMRRQVPGNVYNSQADVVFPFDKDNSNLSIQYVVSDYFKQERVTGIEQFEAGKQHCEFNLGKLACGYYVLEGVALTGKDKIPFKTSLIVAETTDRDAEQARKDGARFGVCNGSPEVSEALCNLGLPFRRAFLYWGPFAGNDPEHFDFTRLQAQMKPGEIFDPKRQIQVYQLGTYPPFIATKGKSIGQMPANKEIYQRYTEELIRQLPANQNLIEIWNEPEDGFTPQEYADLAQWTLESVKKVRPDAVVGPNLSLPNFMKNVMDRGGFKGMDMQTVHPYSPDFMSSPETAELRSRIQVIRKTQIEKFGKAFPIYITEMGWPTPPGGPSAQSEELQARYTARAVLLLAAEDVAGAAFYQMGQSEANPEDRECYFGFSRKDNSPKPVMASVATAARLIEGGKYLGDLHLGTDIGAMVFRQRDGKNMIALYADSEVKKITFDPDAASVMMYNIVGESRRFRTENGKLELVLTDDPIYLVGIGPKVLEKIDGKMQDDWSHRFKRGERDAHRVSGWDEAVKMKLEWEVFRPSVPKETFSYKWGACYDDKYVYIVADVTDSTPGYNLNTGDKIWAGDCLEVFMSAKPYEAIPGFLKEPDFQLLATPFAGGGKNKEAVYGITADSNLRGKPIPGVRMEHKMTDKGYFLCCAIPFSAIKLDGVPENKVIGLEIQFGNAGKDYPRVVTSSNGREDSYCNAAIWSIMHLK